MTKEVFLKNQKAQKIVGLFNIPKGKGPFPIVIICHGFKGYKEQRHLKSLAQQLVKAGIATFRFDFTNEVGESYGKLEDILFSQELKDLKSVMNYVAKQKFVAPKRIGLAGHSLGGQLTFHYTPSDKRIKVLSILAGVTYRGEGSTNLERNVKSQFKEARKTGYFFVISRRARRRYKIKLRYYFDLLKYNTLAQIKKIKIPTLIIHGSKDELVSLKHARTAYKLLKQPKKLEIIKGVPHTWREPKYYKKINPIVVDWFKKYL